MASMETRPWIRYSVQNDSIFWSYCVCFGKDNTDSTFVKKGVKNWKKAPGVKHSSLDKHMHSEEHRMAEKKALSWLKNCTSGNNIASKIGVKFVNNKFKPKKALSQ